MKNIKSKIHWDSNFGTNYKVFVSENNINEFKEVYSNSNGSGSIETIPLSQNNTLLVKIEIIERKDQALGCVINEVEVLG